MSLGKGLCREKRQAPAKDGAMQWLVTAGGHVLIAGVTSRWDQVQLVEEND